MKWFLLAYLLGMAFWLNQVVELQRAVRDSKRTTDAFIFELQHPNMCRGSK